MAMNQPTDDRNDTITKTCSYSSLWPWSGKWLWRESSTAPIGIDSNVLKAIRSTRSSASGLTRLTKPRMTPGQPPPRRSTPCGAYRGATHRQREFQPCRPRMRLSLALSFGGSQNPTAAMRFGLYVETASRQWRSRLVRFNRLGGHTQRVLEPCWKARF